MRINPLQFGPQPYLQIQRSMQPHSQDLRQRIVDLYERGEGSIRALAERFQVSPDSVFHLLKRYRQTGSVAPAAHAGGSQATLRAEHHEVLRELVAADNDATLPQLAQRLEERTQLKVSASTISRTLSKLKITRKKRVSKPAKSTASRTSSSALTTGKTSVS